MHMGTHFVHLPHLLWREGTKKGKLRREQIELGGSIGSVYNMCVHLCAYVHLCVCVSVCGELYTCAQEEVGLIH